MPARGHETVGTLLLLAWVALLIPACGDDPASSESDGAVLDTAPDADLAGLDAAEPESDLSEDLPDEDTEVGADADLADGEADTADVFDPTPVDGAVPIAFDPVLVPTDDVRFPLGVQAGGMADDRVLLWTFAADEATSLLRVWRPSPTRGEVLLVHDQRVAPADGGYVHVPVTGLAPDTVYHYAFFTTAADGSFSGRSLLGRVRTAPAPGAMPVVTLGATSCTSRRFQPWRVLERLAREPLDLFVHLGDMSYNDDATTLEEYRAIWQDTLSDDGYRALYASTGLYATWDDHEVANDYNPESVDAGRFAAAHRSWFESLAVEEGPNGELWRSYEWGSTLEVFILDSRSERRPSTRTSEDALYLSRAQMDWLKAGLSGSPAHFKVVLSSVPITNMPWLWDIGAGDRWEGYAAQRDELLDFIVDEDLRNVWFLAGDFHVGFVSHVEPEGERHRLREIAVGPSGNGPNPLAYTLLEDPQFPFATDELDLANVLVFDPNDNSVRVRVLQDGGAVLYDEVLRD